MIATPATIRWADIQLVLVSAKALSQGYPMPVLCAMSAAPFHAVDCHKGRPQPWLVNCAKGDKTNPYLCRASVMRRGHIAALIEATQRRKGAAEVRRTWGAGVRELRKEDRYVLKRSAP